MEHYTGKAAWQFPDKSVSRVVAIKLTVEAMTGKTSPAQDAE